MPAVPFLNVPDVCTQQPINSHTAFCQHHCIVANDRGYPTTVSEFLKYCSNNQCEGICLNNGHCDIYLQQIHLLAQPPQSQQIFQIHQVYI